MGRFRGMGVGGRGSGPPGNSQVVICFLRNTGTDESTSRSNWTLRVQLLFEGGSHESLCNTLMTKKRAEGIHTKSVFIFRK